MYVYVINKDGNPLMPCKPAKAKHLLKYGKAKVIKRTPFTIKLTVHASSYTQIRNYLTNEQLILELQRFVKTYGKIPETNNLKRKNGYPSAEIYRYRFGSNNNAIRIAGYKPYSQGDNGFQKQYKYNEKFFETMTPISVYILGIMYSDGCIYMNNNQYMIELSLNDEDVVKIVRDNISPQSPIYKKGKSYKLAISSKKIFNDLKGLGCIPKKSLILKKPNIPTDLFPHYVRGYFDGDGCIYIYNQKKITISILGTKDILKHIQKELIKRNINVFNPRIKEKGSNIYVLAMGGSKALSFCELVYNNSQGIYMKRKYEKYKKYITKRSTGFFALSDLEGKIISPSVNVKKNSVRLNARTTTLIERRKAHSSPGQARAVSCA